jgi:L-alanine-DL-glutamate epimerase-like enolase superfamily enzyme
MVAMVGKNVMDILPTLNTTPDMRIARGFNARAQTWFEDPIWTIDLDGLVEPAAALRAPWRVPGATGSPFNPLEIFCLECGNTSCSPVA